MCRPWSVRIGKNCALGLEYVLKTSGTVFPNTDRPRTANNIYLLTEREGRTKRIAVQGLDSTDPAQRGPYKKDLGPIFSQYGPEQAWLIRYLLYD